MAFFQKHFLLLGLIVAITLGLYNPGAGSTFAEIRLAGLSPAQFCVILIFFISGFQLKISDLAIDNTWKIAAIAALLINLLGGPLVAAGIQSYDNYMGQWMGDGLVLGATVILAAPTTLSSAIVLSRQAGGHTGWAVLLTLAVTVVGSLTLPLLGPGVSTDPLFQRMMNLILLVLPPLILGMGLRKMTGLSGPKWLNLIPSLAVITLVWMSVSLYQAYLSSLGASDILLTSLVAALAHLLLLAAAALWARIQGLPRDKMISFCFVSSQKTLPLALAFLMTAPSGQTKNLALMAGAVAFCVIFHFTQIAIDSVLAIRFSSHKPSLGVE